MKQFSVFSNRNAYSQKIKSELTCKLESRGYAVTNTFSSNSELNLSIGGDGAFIKAVHHSGFSKIPFVGINTGHLGFFQEIDAKNLDSFLDAYEKEAYTIEEMLLIEARIATRKSEFRFFALNEFLLKNMWSRMIQFSVSVDGVDMERFAGDGMLIAGPVGSSGHNASLLGAIMHPSVKAFEMTPIAPLHSTQYRSLRNSLIVPEGSVVTLSPDARYLNTCILVVDGTEKRIREIQSIDFFVSKRRINRLSFSENWYWNNLRDKFL